jgi:hypothetical protein
MENKTWRNVDAEAIKYYADKYEGMWFAAMFDEDDDDWGDGSYDINEAVKMLCDEDDNAYICVVDENDGDPCAVDEIHYDDIR